MRSTSSPASYNLHNKAMHRSGPRIQFSTALASIEVLKFFHGHPCWSARPVILVVRRPREATRNPHRHNPVGVMHVALSLQASC